MTRKPWIIGLALGVFASATYLQAERPVAQPFITDVRVDSASETLTINGINFGDSPPSVHLATMPLRVLSGATQNSVTTVLPPLDPGTYLLVVERSDIQAAGVFYLTASAVGPSRPLGPQGVARPAGSTMPSSDASADLASTGKRRLMGSSDALEGATSTFYGLGAGAAVTTGHRNSLFGRSAGSKTTTGAYNTAMGMEGLFSNTTGSHNTSSGFQALYFNTVGARNTVSGALALKNGTTGSYNTAFGYGALNATTTGIRNTALGYLAGANTTGSNNVYIAHVGAAESDTIRIGTSQTVTHLVGTVRAPAFVGNGSGLTKVTAVYAP